MKQNKNPDEKNFFFLLNFIKWNGMNNRNIMKITGIYYFFLEHGT